ncbi:hypothetical protein FJ936_28375 [Mesorhizobium sp. B2-4-13]|uniref:isoprenylcysteine carboxyl methyltransferase family protein n=1 Tax=Mesorhizobium sp. B2-4-13 TaxID=2589936 RepID=UPI00114FED47|nr:isoprenylcysteine carboxylmethyltransferase family protein [Mesorhizobium sp. B2-4-13]TPK81085.1 hypothetical protein FJ936_28375 [Mesorhizobium sp. B2-4-13]
MMWTSIALLGFVTLQRLAELFHARRNTARLLARGGHEVAPRHYIYIVALHATWLAGLCLLAPARPIEAVWFAVFAMAQIARLWVLATLKTRWTTRIIVLPDAPLIATGPYRYLRHPNYVIVAIQIAALPLAFGLPAYAIGFSLLNMIVSGVRLKAENMALATCRVAP